MGRGLILFRSAQKFHTRTFLFFSLTCSLAEFFPSADLGLLGGLSMHGSDRRECLPIAFSPMTSLDMAFIPRRWKERDQQNECFVKWVMNKKNAIWHQHNISLDTNTNNYSHPCFCPEEMWNGEKSGRLIITAWHTLNVMVILYTSLVHIYFPKRLGSEQDAKFSGLGHGCLYKSKCVCVCLDLHVHMWC